MFNLDREQTIALGALGGIFLVCVLTIGVSIGMRSAAQQELVDRQDMLARLQAQAARQPVSRSSQLVAGTAPAAAFIAAPTAGLASAQLQTHIEQVAASQQATLMSSGVDTAAHDATPDAIRMQATLDLHLKSLQALLYQLESGTPYVFVETLSVQPSASEAGSDDPTLHLTVGVRALWRRSPT